MYSQANIVVFILHNFCVVYLLHNYYVVALLHILYVLPLLHEDAAASHRYDEDGDKWKT